jgi:outer membrane receptor protein involved in Fe transport
VAPIGLWQQAVQSANSHFNGIDLTAAPIGTFIDPRYEDIGPLDQYPYQVVDQPGRRFYRALRTKLGVPLNEYVNVEAIDPSQLSLDMFSPRELTDRNLVSYYGYDYLGNPTADGITFNDFFRLKDADGARTLPVAPLNPLYQAAFLKDKFTFNNMIFSLGVRVERFDLNTKVMKDPYSLYQIMTAKDYFATVPEAPDVRPGTIGDDFKVYTVSDQDNSPVAFRNGDTWYFPDGRQANDGVSIYGSGGVVNPLLVDPVRGGEITSDDFDPNTAFEDYTPQVNWLPRMGFSFPISEDANFFAHYDVLVQRPTNYQVTALDYFYFYTAGRTPENNASLKPEKVVDYEVGFQQRLNQNSALKFSAYYREMRDMTQSRTINQVPIIGQYTTYGNIDFGTVKGFTVQYDLRRIQNAELRLAYTLQFADGTGSNANSQRGLTRLGNIRNLFPLDFDERHNISGILDYRFSEGREYNGPRIGNSDILSNFGANLQLTAVSGRPYTSNLRATQFGGDGIQGAINGNRLPWRFTLDLRVDKSFTLTGKDKKRLNLNVYLRVANLLNRKNVQAVYSVTGSPTDDGYLATAEGANVVGNILSQGRNPQAYLDSYSWLVRNPDFFTQPRRIYVGAAFDF